MMYYDILISSRYLAEYAHNLPYCLIFLPSLNRISRAGLEVIFQNEAVCFLESLLHSLRLVEHIDAVFITLYHFDYFLKMASGNFESVKNSFLIIFWLEH